MMTIVVQKSDSSGKLKIEALTGYFDDMVMAAGIALCVHYETPMYEATPRSKFRVTYSGDPEMRWMAT